MLRRPAFAARWTFLAILASVLAPSLAWARESPLEGQPAVRHKYELRASRFEITPTFEASISASFKHTLSGGLKLEYHITDNFSIGAMGFFGGGLNTGLMDQIVDSLPAENAPYPTPSQQDALNHANTIPFHGGAGLTFTPWFGKLALFSKAFVSYDLYLSGGFGFAITQNDFSGDDRAVVCDANCDDADVTKHAFTDPRNDGPHNAGFNPGIQFCVCMHI
jgi:hypothetical protein